MYMQPNNLFVFVTWRPDHRDKTFIDLVDHIKRKGFNKIVTTPQTLKLWDLKHTCSNFRKK